MDRVLCVILCIAVMVVAVCVLRYCAEPVVVEPAAEFTTEPVGMETEEPTVETTIATEPIETEPPIVLETTVEETEPPYTEDELEMMALVIYQEAGGDDCSDETRLMVGTVVMNRVADDRFPNTIRGVLTQRAQYGLLHWTGLVWPARANARGEANAVARAYDCAERILLGERLLPSDVIWQAEFEQGTEVVAYQDGMYFCR